MALMERVATLVRANLNDLLDKAENPEKMLKQVILDMENQFIQVKTQTAIGLADLHLLEKKKQEILGDHSEWMRKAGLAVDKQDDKLACAALARAVALQEFGETLDLQIERQAGQVESMKSALKRLDHKLSEARARADLLIMQRRRARAQLRAANSNTSDSANHAVERMRSEIVREEAIGAAESELLSEDIDARLQNLEREQKISAMLEDLKARKRTGL